MAFMDRLELLVRLRGAQRDTQLYAWGWLLAGLDQEHLQLLVDALDEFESSSSTGQAMQLAVERFHPSRLS